MANPITWRNVEAPDLRGVSHMMGLAGNTINAGFDNLNSVINKETARQEANWQTQKTNNTQAFLDEIGKFRTPEEYQAALQSGQLDQMRQGFSGQIDQAAARSAQDGRVAVLQNRATAGNAFQESQDNFAAKPIKEQAATLAMEGRTDELAALRAANPQITDWASTVKAGYEGATAKNARALQVALQPGLIPNAVATQKAETRQLNEATRLADESQMKLNLEKRLLSESAAYNEQQQGVGKAMGKVAFALSLPVDKQGIPKFGELTTEQTKSFNEMLFAKKLPSTTQYETGDTGAADALHQRIATSGEYPASFVEANKATIRSALDSNKNVGNVGNAADARKTANSQEEAVMNQMSQNTWQVPGSPNALRNADQVKVAVTDLVEEKYRTLANRAIQDVLTKGIKLKDGKFETPSLEDIKAELGSTNDNLWDMQGWGDGGGDFGDKLKFRLAARMNGSNFTEQRKNRATVETYNLKKDASAIYSKGNTVTPFNK